jgi:hypothetical protein
MASKPLSVFKSLGGAPPRQWRHGLYGFALFLGVSLALVGLVAVVLLVPGLLVRRARDLENPVGRAGRFGRLTANAECAEPSATGVKVGMHRGQRTGEGFLWRNISS